MKQKGGKGYLQTSKNRQPSSDDKSTGLKGSSTNTRATRGSKAAKSPKSLGPRTA